MFSMERFLDEKVLKKSQITRPRKWVPWVCLFAFLLSAALGAYYMLLVFSENPFSQMLIAALPAIELTINNMVFGALAAFAFFFLPAANVILLIFPLVVSKKLCKYRKAYWWYGFFLVLGYILVPLVSILYGVYLITPGFQQFFQEYVPLVPVILSQATLYGNFILPFMFALFMFFGLFYNVNYPAHYERIYELRKKRLKSLATYDERALYKRDFYWDYMVGNWDSMLFNLFCIYYDPKNRDSMPADAFEFLIHYTEKCDGKMSRAVFNELAAEGRYLECRAHFQKALSKADAIDHGAKVSLPHYEPPKPKKPKPAPKPAKLDPPLAPEKTKRTPSARVKTWAPEDIG